MKKSSNYIEEDGLIIYNGRIIRGGRSVPYEKMFDMTMLARRPGCNGGFEFLFLDELTNSIYEGVADKYCAGAYEIKRLGDDYFKVSTVEQLSDMLWFELGWSINKDNSLKENPVVQKLFKK